jgi:hypothetical protein
MFVLPISFSKEHKNTLTHTNEVLEYRKGNVAIDPGFSKLITALRTAVENRGTLDKESVSHNDIFDAFRLALKFYHFEDSSSKYN